MTAGEIRLPAAAKDPAAPGDNPPNVGASASTNRSDAPLGAATVRPVVAPGRHVRDDGKPAFPSGRRARDSTVTTDGQAIDTGTIADGLGLDRHGADRRFGDEPAERQLRKQHESVLAAIVEDYPDRGPEPVAAGMQGEQDGADGGDRIAGELDPQTRAGLARARQAIAEAVMAERQRWIVAISDTREGSVVAAGQDPVNEALPFDQIPLVAVGELVATAIPGPRARRIGHDQPVVAGGQSGQVDRPIRAVQAHAGDRRGGTVASDQGDALQARIGEFQPRLCKADGSSR